jgi:ADP-heptose:LPS heptosyltransferase
MMVWSPDKDFSYAEASKIAPLIVHYIQGRCLDVGPGTGKVWPQAIGFDRQMDQGRPTTDIVGDADDLSMFADNAFDAVFSSHCLEDFERDKVPEILEEWARVLKVGGNLVLYVPSANLYPKVGEKGANPAHKWDIYPGDIEALLQDQIITGPGRFGHGWTLLRSEERGDGDEYSLLIIARKESAPVWKTDLWKRNPDGRQRALVVRYGAIGDAFVASSVFPLLKAQGYHVTVNTTPRIRDILRENPHIDEWLIQETDYVPNGLLGPYWEVLSKDYDKVINLCESVEGALLTLPGRLTHDYPLEARQRIMGTVNYQERTHDIAGVAYDFTAARFYPTAKEVAWARGTRERLLADTAGWAPIVVWCVNGSAAHKVYPFTHIVCRWLLERTPVRIVLYGDTKIGTHLADAIIQEVGDDYGDAPRISNISNKWPIRDSLAFLPFADVVVGPETGPLNAAAMEDVAKVVYLSHSSMENLTKHWRNTTTLLPVDTPCYPCHQLHMDWTYCRRVETGAAMCASSIKPESIFRAIAHSLGAVVREAAD